VRVGEVYSKFFFVLVDEYMYVYISVCIHACIYVNMYPYIEHEYMYMCTYVYIYMHVYISIYIYQCIEQCEGAGKGFFCVGAVCDKVFFGLVDEFKYMCRCIQLYEYIHM